MCKHESVVKLFWLLKLKIIKPLIMRFPFKFTAIVSSVLFVNFSTCAGHTKDSKLRLSLMIRKEISGSTE